MQEALPGMSKKRTSRAVLLLALLSTPLQQTAVASAEAGPPNPLSGIFGALKRALSPTTAELEQLIASKDYFVAADFLREKASDLREEDIKKFKSLIAPEIQKVLSERSEELARITLNESSESVLASGKILSIVVSEWREKIEPNAPFLGLETQGFKDIFNQRQTEWYRLSERTLKTAIDGDLVDGEELERYKELAQQTGAQLPTSICETALGDSTTRQLALKNCSLFLSPTDLANLRINAATRDLERLEPSESAYERVVALSRVSKDWRLTLSEWEKLISPRLPTITQISAENSLNSLVTQDKKHAVLIKKSSRPSQKISKETKRSEYVSGQITLPNPQYLELQRYYEQTTIQYQNCNANYRVQALSNPYAINFCLVMLPNLNRAQSALASTSPTTTQDQKTPYQYEVDNVSVRVNEDFILALYSSEKKDYFFKTTTAVREKSFSFATGIHPQDPSISQSSFSQDKDIQEFVNQSSQIDALSIFEFGDSKDLNFGGKQLLALLGESRAPASTGQVASTSRQSSPQQQSTTANQRVLNSVVVVNSRNSIGSGFYVRPRFILTNEHVVASQSMVEIELRGGEKHTGIVIATDPLLDLALIAVPKDGQALQFSRSDPTVGSEAIALGHPRGLKFSLTRGVVSAMREFEVGRGGIKKLAFIQTDVAINPGNSGGPLVVDGLVVGINTFKIGGKNSEGLGFALAASEAVDWLEQNLPR
jgi:S1-C subfamily serine protease